MNKFLALIAVAASALVPNAFAATSLGTLIPGGSPATASFNSYHQALDPNPDSFVDVYTFAINPGGALVGIAASSEIELGSVQLTGINAFKIELYDSSNVQIALSGAPVLSGPLPCGPGITCETQSVVLSVSPLASGNYRLEVSGDPVGSGGSYGGSISVAAVPEAHEWAMMLAGLGMVGVMTSRRRRAAESA